MNVRLCFILTLSILGFCSLLSAPAQGPDDKGSVLRSPFDEPAPSRPMPKPSAIATGPSSPPVTPGYPKSIFPDAKAANPNAIRLANPDDAPDINRDLQVTPAAGNWLILVISYISSPATEGRPGKDGAVEARKMCLELKNKNRVPAYIFVFGAEDRRKEYERVKKILDDQQAFFKERNMWPEDPPRVRTQHIDVQHAVLIGGYPDSEAANRALATIRTWPQPDEKKVALETKFYRVIDSKDPSKTERAEIQYVNPFKRAIICRNPTVKQEAAQEAKLDPAALRRLNADEPFSLFTCKKPFTLAVKEFQTPFMMHDRATPASIWDTIGATNKSHEDFAQISADNLADSLRKVKLEAYALHTKFSSTVTVGSFDGPNDPALKSMQETLATRFNQPPFTQIQFFHRPVPMPVPH